METHSALTHTHVHTNTLSLKYALAQFHAARLGVGVLGPSGTAPAPRPSLHLCGAGMPRHSVLVALLHVRMSVVYFMTKLMQTC